MDQNISDVAVGARIEITGRVRNIPDHVFLRPGTKFYVISHNGNGYTNLGSTKGGKIEKSVSKNTKAFKIIS